jgi:hypothetical protein
MTNLIYLYDKDCVRIRMKKMHFSYFSTRLIYYLGMCSFGENTEIPTLTIVTPVLSIVLTLLEEGVYESIL